MSGGVPAAGAVLGPLRRLVDPPASPQGGDGFHPRSTPRAGLPSLKARLGERIAGSAHLSDAQRARVRAVLEAQLDGDRLCHGDLHLENVLLGHGRPCVIDWSNAAAGPPAADVARSLVILRFGETPAGAPAVVRRLAPALRRLVVSRYLRAYRTLRPGSLTGLRDWEVVLAAARLGETTSGESSRIRAWPAARVAPW